jgi:DNA polymerase elongation subunit (family B)
MVDFWNRHEKEDFDLEFSVLENPPTMLSLTHPLGKLVVIDTFNYWKTGVAQMGESLGMPKLEMPTSTKIDKAWKEYCLRDVEVIANQILRLFRFLRDNDLGSFKISAPGLAFGTFRRRFMKHEIYLHDRASVLALERNCYYGGLVNNFYLGSVNGETIYKYDVNSLYPAMMLKDYPTKLLESHTDISPSKLAALIRNQGGCAWVDIEEYGRTYPKRHNGRLCDVKGKFSTYLCGDELKHALKVGSITRVRFASVYEVAPIFKEYVKYFWDLRRKYQTEGDKVGEQFVKLLMNSLYGRFGMKGHKWVDFNSTNLQLYYTYYGVPCPTRYLNSDFCPIVSSFRHRWEAEGLDEAIVLRYFGGKLEMQFPTGEHRESFCAISAFVTAYAREYLRFYITVLGENEVLYCDTDSLFVTKTGSDRLKDLCMVDPGTLGKFKLEGKAKKCTFYGPKDYVFQEHIVRKGIRKNAVQVNHNTFEQDSFEQLKSVLNRGGEPFIIIKKIQKTLQRQLVKGVRKSYGRVTPLILNCVGQ